MFVSIYKPENASVHVTYCKESARKTAFSAGLHEQFLKAREVYIEN